MTRTSRFILLTAALCGFVFPIKADTFKNNKTGEVFYGFRTQKNTASQTLVYNEALKKHIPVDLRDYEVTMDGKGRRNSVVAVSITDGEVLLSETVTDIVCEAIVKASNTGPQFVLLKIDNPGGRGEYMKKLCSTIANTNNCNVIAYVSGGRYGGAYSAAAILALACNKVFIAPTASIAAIGPFGDLSADDFIKLYSSDNLASYSVFVATLAEQHQRPALLAKSLLDKKISVVEVTDTDGKIALIEKNLRLPTQTIVRTLCEGYSIPLEKADSSTEQKTTSTTPADIHNRVLNLTASDAVRLKLADRLCYSVQDVLAEMNVSDAQVANAPGIDTAIKQFSAARKNIRQRLTKIEFLESRAATLEEQLVKLEQEIRTTPTTRTKTSIGQDYYRNEKGNVVLGGGSRGYRSTEVDSTNYDQVDNVPLNTPNRNRYNMVRRNYGPGNGTESITSAEPSTASEQAKVELYYVLSDLIAEYRQTINTAKRWVGSLPSEIQLQTLEKNMNSAMALAENLRFRS